MDDTVIKPMLRWPPLWVSLVVCLVLFLSLAWLRLDINAGRSVSIAFGVPIVMVACLRRRWLLWTMACAFTAITLINVLILNPERGAPSEWTSATMVLADLFVVTLICDLFLRNQIKSADHGEELSERNALLSHQRNENARQTEALQSQTLELERQREELRIINEHLAARQNLLQALLDLSRLLSPNMRREQALLVICQALMRMLPGSEGAAIMERQGQSFRIICHLGFGDQGPDTNEIDASKAFAGMVISHHRAACLEDIALRPDLLVAQPVRQAPFKSLLAAPMKTSINTEGAVEAYSRKRHGWTLEEIMLIESIAVQGSFSLSTSQLFADVENEGRRLQTILDTVPFGVAIISADATSLHLNVAGAAMLSVPADINGQLQSTLSATRIFKSGEEMSSDQVPILRGLRGELLPPEELEIRFDDGRQLFLLNSAAPIRDRAGTITGAVAAFADITAQKTLQNELDRRRREAEELSTRKSRFLAAASHDIRTPANAISLLAELIQRSIGDPEAIKDIPELAQELQKSSMGMVNLISDVLDLTRLDTGRTELKETVFELTPWLSDLCRQLKPLAEKKKLAFECQTPAQSFRLRGDRIKLARVVTNLIGNAIKFTEEGSVQVQCSVDEAGITISVRDTGIGIEKENFSRIFDEYLQLKHPGRERDTGSGLGLSIAKRLIELMGGRLDVESTPGKGSTFTVKLPPSCIVAS